MKAQRLFKHRKVAQSCQELGPVKWAIAT